MSARSGFDSDYSDGGPSRDVIVASLFWKLSERGGAQLVQLLVQILLARLLTPADFGVIALVVVFMSVASAVTQAGLTAALIQRPSVSSVDLSTAFWVSLLLGIVAFVALYVAAPAIASFFDVPEFSAVLRVVGISLPLSSFVVIQNAWVARRMLFRMQFRTTLVATLVAGGVSVAAALAGAGVWALVIQQLVSLVLGALLLGSSIRWLPRLRISIAAASELLTFGWRLLVAAVLDALYTNLRTFTVGKLFPPSVLGYFNRGEAFPAFAITSLNTAIQTVLLPAMSSRQDESERVRTLLSRAIVASGFVVFPVMTIFGACARNLVIVLLTERWLPAVPFLQIGCVAYAFWPIHSANLQALNALGRSDLYLSVEVVKKVLGVAILIATIPFGVYAIAAGGAVASVISTVINAFPNGRALNYGFLHQLIDMVPSLVLSGVAGAAMIALDGAFGSPLVGMLVQVTVGASLYLLLARVFKVRGFFIVRETLLRMKVRGGTD